MNADISLVKTIKDLRQLAYDLRGAVSRFRNAGNLYSYLANGAGSCSSHAESLEREMHNYAFSPEQSASFSGIIKGINRNIAEAKKFADRAKAKGFWKGFWGLRNRMRAAVGRKLREIEGQLDHVQHMLGSLDQRLAGEFRGMMANMVLENQEAINAIRRDSSEIRRNAALLPGINNRLELLERQSTPPPPSYHSEHDTPLEVHEDIQCDGCHVCPIVGTRWHCARCLDQDLCDKCHTKGWGRLQCVWNKVSVEETRARNDAVVDMLGRVLTRS